MAPKRSFTGFTKCSIFSASLVSAKIDPMINAPKAGENPTFAANITISRHKAKEIIKSISSVNKGFSFLWPYLRPYKKLIRQLFIGVLVGAVIQFMMPFLMQSVVDIGVNNEDIPFIYIILIAQLVLFLSQTLVTIFREWLLLHVTGRFNIKMVSDFLFKMLKLPVNFFDTRNTGEHLQRIQYQPC